MELRSCGDINIGRYSKQSIEYVGKVVVNCQHGNIVKQTTFYMTSVANTKVILGLKFCKTFGLVSVNCDEKCPCKQISIDVINNEFPRGLEIPVSTDVDATVRRDPVDINTKLWSDPKAHIMELFPNVFGGIGMIKDVIMNHDVNPDAVPVVQPPRKVPQAMIEPLEAELNWMEELGIIQKLNIIEVTDWCHNLVLVQKPNGKLSLPGSKNNQQCSEI